MNRNEQFERLESNLGRTLSFLESHYIIARESGTNQRIYVVSNDIDDNKDLCEKLKNTYNKYLEMKNAN